LHVDTPIAPVCPARVTLPRDVEWQDLPSFLSVLPLNGGLYDEKVDPGPPRRGS
jgi:hypothetical protein